MNSHSVRWDCVWVLLTPRHAWEPFHCCRGVLQFRVLQTTYAHCAFTCLAEPWFLSVIVHPWSLRCVGSLPETAKPVIYKYFPLLSKRVWVRGLDSSISLFKVVEGVSTVGFSVTEWEILFCWSTVRLLCCASWFWVWLVCKTEEWKRRGMDL